MAYQAIAELNDHLSSAISIDTNLFKNQSCIKFPIEEAAFETTIHFDHP